MKKRLISLVFAAILLFTLVSCQTTGSNTSNPAESSQTAASGESQNTSSEESGYTLRDKDFDGRTFTILQRSERSYEFKRDENVSDLINTQIAERNNLVEERYKVKIETIEQLGDWASWETFTKYVDDTVRGGLADYDLISGYAVSMPTLVSSGTFVNWYELKDYMNLEADWWYQDFIDQMSIGGKLYMISGDLSLTMWESMIGIFFNKTLVEANPDIDNLYDVVRNREWTYDYFETLLKQVAPSTNVSDDEKIYSYSTFLTTQIDVWQDAFNIPVTEKDSSGKPYFTVGNSEKMVDAVSKIYDLAYNDYTYISKTDYEGSLEQFGKGKACFVPLSLNSGTTLKGYQVDYGVLPMPMYDANQDTYHTTCQDFYSVFSVPLTSADDKEFVGTITEALCYYSNQVVVPEYYNVVLKLRNTFDADSAEMIDTIRSGVLCNFGYLYSMALEWPAHQMNVLINAKSKEWVSNWQSKEGTFNAKLDELLEIYFK